MQDEVKVQINGPYCVVSLLVLLSTRTLAEMSQHRGLPAVKEN